ncbi:hypothetical protein AF335_12425 [Streptomyces eurocidicus]|uniref:HAD superfamily hydrolase (TIGR01490 family) n=1 Tax=Streptomyces eurocidicus TaxID=66423 RepID=A0A2N8NXY7_STREU|nr:HAD-IB family hydrolase [Streptomyces eurocidicus]MBB5119740.1 HAD superfamily hydrolase (TIGR01490 family) [Streptomyces eurocidicus]MBF6050763.1 HAD-IB family hydrolase [Streptomyces eurocidicus]PNE33637.1 hypothetical protein AF335_12425 [Streptomyces eurocidicus]
MSTAAPGVAFFDVDETLITLKSMFDFYDFFLDSLGHSAEEKERLSRDARDLLTPGLPREQGNRLFYRRFAGYAVDQVAETGRRWFDHHRARGGLFHDDVLAALRAHRADGVETVLVSGSFPACLDPVAAYAGADRLYATVLEARDGHYTGEVLRTMIGDAKAETARAVIEERRVAAGDCYAYGDHVSDLDLLRLVGHPVAVGTHPAVVEEAERLGWRRLPGTAEALTTP